MNKLIQYANGWGHLIFSCVLAIGLFAMLGLGRVDLQTFYFMLSPIVLFWFGTGIANRVSDAIDQATASAAVAVAEAVTKVVPPPESKDNAT